MQGMDGRWGCRRRQDGSGIKAFFCPKTRKIALENMSRPWYFHWQSFQKRNIRPEEKNTPTVFGPVDRKRG
jgi:hypothetical protein